MKGSFIEVVWFSEEFAEDQARRDGARAGRNWRLWETGRKPSAPDDIQIGDLAIPHEAHWYRGFGVVDEVDAYGRVWAVYGPREGADPTQSDPVRCYTPWTDVIVSRRAG